MSNEWLQSNEWQQSTTRADRLRKESEEREGFRFFNYWNSFSAVVMDVGLTAHEFALYGLIMMRANWEKKSDVALSKKFITEKLKMGHETVYRARESLRQKELIAFVTSENKSCTVYRLRVPSRMAQSGTDRMAQLRTDRMAQKWSVMGLNGTSEWAQTRQGDGLKRVTNMGSNGDAYIRFNKIPHKMSYKRGGVEEKILERKEEEKKTKTGPEPEPDRKQANTPNGAVPDWVAMMRDFESELDI